VVNHPQEHVRGGNFNLAKCFENEITSQYINTLWSLNKANHYHDGVCVLPVNLLMPCDTKGLCRGPPLFLVCCDCLRFLPWAPPCLHLCISDLNCIDFHDVLKGVETWWLVLKLESGSSGLGLSPGWEHCVVFFGKTLYYRSASLDPEYKLVAANLMMGVA